MSTSVILGAAISATGNQKFTIVRTYGLLSLMLRSATAIGDGFTGAFGIGKATAAAFTAGIASLPTPLMEVDWDGWLVHQFFDVRTGIDTSDGAGNAA